LASAKLEIALLLLLTCFATDALADGCFVFKWDKKIDINEPTQKAIIVFDAGREEILLQVKYGDRLRSSVGWSQRHHCQKSRRAPWSRSMN